MCILMKAIAILLALIFFSSIVFARETTLKPILSIEPVLQVRFSLISAHLTTITNNVEESKSPIVRNYLTLMHWNAIKRLFKQLPEEKQTIELKEKFANLSKGFMIRPFGPYAKFHKELKAMVNGTQSTGKIYNVSTKVWLS